jgi:hypothetical protein
LRVVETHPGGDEFDCLTLVPLPGTLPSLKGIELNKRGAAHVFRRDDEITLDGFWDALATADDPRVVVKQLEDEAGLPGPATTPPDSAVTLTYRVVATFLTHGVLSKSRWECRSGITDASDGGAGPRASWFRGFPQAQTRLGLRDTDDIRGEPAYRFWFLVDDNEPRVCFETTGWAWDTHGKATKMLPLFQRERRVWPVVIETAGHLLP